MRAVAAVRSSREALLGRNSQRLDIGLLGARTAATLRRIIEGLPVEEADRSVLSTASGIMESAAEAIEVVEGGSGRLERGRRSLSFGAMAFTVELAAPTVPPPDLPEFLKEIAATLRGLESDPDAERAELLLPAFSALAEIATVQSGSVGEGGGPLI
jgi:hypothetical protein